MKKMQGTIFLIQINFMRKYGNSKNPNIWYRTTCRIAEGTIYT